MIWDHPETRCGVGSTLAATAAVRDWLPGALERLGVKVLLDAPCGDRHWMRHVELPCAYVGVDHEPAHVEKAGPGVAMLIDIRDGGLPPCDAILSRDFMQHLSKADEARVLAAFRETGARWLIATCHGAEGEDVETGPQAFRRVDLRTRFGPPVDQVDDGRGGRILGVWAL